VRWEKDEASPHSSSFLSKAAMVPEWTETTLEVKTRKRVRPLPHGGDHRRPED